MSKNSARARTDFVDRSIQTAVFSTAIYSYFKKNRMTESPGYLVVPLTNQSPQGFMSRAVWTTIRNTENNKQLAVTTSDNLDDEIPF